VSIAPENSVGQSSEAHSKEQPQSAQTEKLTEFAQAIKQEAYRPAAVSPSTMRAGGLHWQRVMIRRKGALGGTPAAKGFETEVDRHGKSTA
jgi:hypothetical protein